MEEKINKGWKTMNILTKTKHFIFDKSFRWMILQKKGFFNYMDDKTFVERQYRAFFGIELDLKHPKTFNQKLQWLKLYDHNPEYVVMVDKYLAKDYVANIIGEKYIIPTIGVWDKPEDIDFDMLPEQFVLKCNHNSSTGMYFCTDRNKLNMKKVRKGLKKGFTQNYYLNGREWPYKDVQRKIIAEPYLTDESGYELKDYKIFCFNGIPRMIQVDFDRFRGHKRNLYDLNWNLIKAEIKFQNGWDTNIEKPVVLDELLDLASKLSLGYPHIRTDFYVVGEQIYFGELTLCHGSGTEEFRPAKFGETVGAWIDLSLIQNNR